MVRKAQATIILAYLVGLGLMGSATWLSLVTPIVILWVVFPLYTILCLFLLWNVTANAYVRKNTAEIAKLYQDTKQSLDDNLWITAAAIDAKDGYSVEHSRNVAAYARYLATELGLPVGAANRVFAAALLHDLGKVQISDTILHKPSRLTAVEFAEVRKHPAQGARVLLSARGKVRELAEIVHSHHERYDGKGYPRGIPLTDVERAILPFADALDAMTTKRPFRKPLTNEEILAEVKFGRGRQFHPQVVDTFLRLTHTQSGQDDAYSFTRTARLQLEALEQEERNRPLAAGW